jgi:hypothetical protein
VFECVALRLASPEGVVTWFVTGSRIASIENAISRTGRQTPGPGMTWCHNRSTGHADAGAFPSAIAAAVTTPTADSGVNRPTGLRPGFRRFRVGLWEILNKAEMDPAPRRTTYLAAVPGLPRRGDAVASRLAKYATKSIEPAVVLPGGTTKDNAAVYADRHTHQGG